MINVYFLIILLKLLIYSLKRLLMQLILANFNQYIKGQVFLINTLYKFSFGLIDEYVFYLLILFIMMICYVVVRPFISWFVTLQSIRLLSYIFSSLFVLLLIFIVKLSIYELDNFLVNLIKVTLHCLAIFGFGLGIFHGVQKLFKKDRV